MKWLAPPGRSPSESPWAVLVHAPAFFRKRRGRILSVAVTAPTSMKPLPSRNHPRSNSFCRWMINLNARSGATRGPDIVKAASQLG
jgi:hypothetical protein